VQNAERAGLFALQPNAIHNKARDLGLEPVLEWLKLKALRVDRTYQREITARARKNIDRIVAEFRWGKFAPLVVAPVHPLQSGARKGLYCIIDGQHRATAAMEIGLDRVPCQVVFLNPEQQAEAFAAINGDVTRTNIFQVYKAALAARTAWAVGIFECAVKANVRILIYPVERKEMKPGDTLAISHLREMFIKYGDKLLINSLRSITLGKNRPGEVRACVLRALVPTIANNQAWRDAAAEQLVPAIARVDLLATNDISTLRDAFREKLTKYLGQGVQAEPLDAQVAELLKRKFTPMQIAARLRAGHTAVLRAVERVKSRQGGQFNAA
jgi:hypothetical protein